MTNNPETIYLIPGEDVDGAPCMVWCDDPAPSHSCDSAEAVEYVRANSPKEMRRRADEVARFGSRMTLETGVSTWSFQAARYARELRKQADELEQDQ